MPQSFYQRHPGLRSLAHRDYRLLLAGSTLVALVGPFQFLTQVFWVQAEYPDHSVFYTSVISSSRGLAMLLFSLLGGAIADRMERRKVLLACEIASLTVNAVVALLMIVQPFGGATIIGVTACTFAAAGVMSIDAPARSASMPAVVGMESLTNAISLNMVASQLMLAFSLPLVGVLNEVFKPGEVYAASLLAWAGILPLIAMLRYRSTGGGRSAGMFANIREGLRYTRASAVISGVLAIVVAVQLLGMPVVAPLGPVFMIEVLGFTTTQVGFMATTWGLGAMAASFLFARLQWLTVRGATLCAVGMVFGITVLGFGYSRFIPLTAVSDFGMGFTFTATMLTSSTLVQHVVADEMRGRVMGLFPFTLGSAYLFTAPLGALGQAVGLAFLIPALGWVTLLLCGSVIALRPAVIRARPAPAVGEALLPAVSGAAE